MLALACGATAHTHQAARPGSSTCTRCKRLRCGDPCRTSPQQAASPRYQRACRAGSTQHSWCPRHTRLSIVGRRPWARSANSSWPGVCVGQDCVFGTGTAAARRGLSGSDGWRTRARSSPKPRVSVPGGRGESCGRTKTVPSAFHVLAGERHASLYSRLPERRVSQRRL